MRQGQPTGLRRAERDDSLKLPSLHAKTPRVAATGAGSFFIAATDEVMIGCRPTAPPRVLYRDGSPRAALKPSSTLSRHLARHCETMNTVSIKRLLLPLAAAALVASASQRVLAQGAAQRGAVVFVVSGDASSSDVTLDALVRVERGRFAETYAQQDVSAARLFAEEFFRPGRKYRLTFGGGDAGAVTIKAATEGCNNMHASGAADTSAPLRGRVMGLATDSETLGRRPGSRRPPEASERAAVLELVRRIYRQRRTPASLLADIQVTNLTATDLDGDGRPEMVGSFTLESTGRRRRDLFLIAATRARAGLVADFVNFQSYRLPSEGFDSAVDFADQLDMDGDGTAEVVAVQHGFDAYGYTIFKKRRGRWSAVYSTTGDAC